MRSAPERGSGSGGLQPVISEEMAGFLDVTGERDVLTMELLERPLAASVASTERSAERNER
jgi:hypothetical protein